MKQTTANLIVLAVLVGAGAAPSSACGGKPAESPTSGSAGAASAETGAAAPSTPSSQAASAPAASSSAPAPLAPVETTDQKAVDLLYEAANNAPAATLKPKGLAGPETLVKGLRELAKKAAPGMQPEGPLVTATLKDKEHVQTDITLHPGKCYTLVGYSEKVKDLDLYLFGPPHFLTGQDIGDDNKPVLGGASTPMCPAGAAAMTYKLDIFSDAGAGDFAVQLYVKGK